MGASRYAILGTDGFSFRSSLNESKGLIRPAHF